MGGFFSSHVAMKELRFGDPRKLIVSFSSVLKSSRSVKISKETRIQYEDAVKLYVPKVESELSPEFLEGFFLTNRNDKRGV